MPSDRLVDGEYRACRSIYSEEACKPLSNGPAVGTGLAEFDYATMTAQPIWGWVACPALTFLCRNKNPSIDRRKLLSRLLVVPSKFEGHFTVITPIIPGCTCQCSGLHKQYAKYTSVICQSVVFFITSAWYIDDHGLPLSHRYKI